MMVVSNLFNDSSHNTITVISSEGQREEVRVTNAKFKDLSFDQNKALLAKLNQLRQDGWRVVNVIKVPKGCFGNVRGGRNHLFAGEELTFLASTKKAASLRGSFFC